MYRLSAFYFAHLAGALPMDLSIPTVFVVLVRVSCRPSLVNSSFYEA